MDSAKFCDIMTIQKNGLIYMQGCYPQDVDVTRGFQGEEMMRSDYSKNE